jgi:hypothetical protein
MSLSLDSGRGVSGPSLPETPEVHSDPPFRATMHFDFMIARLLALIARDVLR